MNGPQAQIDFELLVGKDGSVLEAKLIKGSSDTAWNAAALASMRKWKYTPAYYKDQPLKIWLHQTAIVRFVESHCVCLAEISCGTQTEADSAYALLTSGVQFEDVVQKFSLSESKKEGGKLGNVNILKFPKHLQLQIMSLEPEQYTKPIAYNNHYVIFKKLKP